MKKFYILIFIGLSYLQSYSQTKPVDILVGKNEASVRLYFSKLKSLFPNNKNISIEETVDDEGDLILMFETPVGGEEKTGSSFISCLFVRTDARDEVCAIQAISLTDKYIYRNLKQIKDTFQEGKKPSTWYTVSSSTPTFYLLAKFSKPSPDNGKWYILKYSIATKTEIEN